MKNNFFFLRYPIEWIAVKNKREIARGSFNKVFSIAKKKSPKRIEILWVPKGGKIDLEDWYNNTILF